jgi:hypothetical protein
MAELKEMATPTIDEVDHKDLKDQFYEFLSGRANADNALSHATEIVTMHTDDHTDVHTDHSS